MPKKHSKVNQDNIRAIASDAVSDVVYSVLTDVISRLEEQDLLKDLPKVIDTIDSVTSEIGMDGIKLRRANIERRLVARKGKKTMAPPRATTNVEWVPHPKDKKLEYTTGMEIGKRYVLRKVGTNKVVGLLDKNLVKDKKKGYGLNDDRLSVISSAEQLMLTGRGFDLDNKRVKQEPESETEEEETDEESSGESSGEESDEESSDEEIPVVVKKKKSKK
jgi:hypothetical protein